MKTLLFTIMALIFANTKEILFDFSSPKTSGQWYVVNDGVMGGLSNSDWNTNLDGTVTFSGTVSLENNGGFASVRTQVQAGKQESFKGVALRIKGDGNLYSIRFRTNNNFDGYAYQAKIKTDKGKWKEFEIPFEAFKPTYRGYILKNKPALKSKNIAQIGILIAVKQVGDFTVTMDWIKLYN